jgi:peptidoglycan DL-endopeptidase CwlO
MYRLFTFLLLLFVLASCGTQNEKENYQHFHKNAMEDPELLQNDTEIHNGDLGIENVIEDYVAQNPPTKEEYQSSKFSAMHHNWQFPQLHQVWVNPNVKAVDGSYVNNLTRAATRYLGTPYKFGSDRNDPSFFDCSDFVRWTHLWALGMDLPKDSRSQDSYVQQFSKRKYTDLRQAKRGDVLFFMEYRGWQPQDYTGINKQTQRIAHNGIYLGNGKMIHTASQKTGGVRIDDVFNTHLEYRFVRGGQIIQ